MAVKKRAGRARRRPRFDGEVVSTNAEPKVARALGEAAAVLAAAVRVEGANGELEPLSAEMVEKMSDPEELQRLIEDQWPEEHLAMLSAAPTNAKTRPLVSPFVELSTGEAFDDPALIENVLEILSLCHAVRSDAWDRDIRTDFEAEALRKLPEVIAAYRADRERLREEAAMFVVVDEVVAVYKKISAAWPKRMSRNDGKGAEKLGDVRTEEQQRVIAWARTKLTSIVDLHVMGVRGSKPKNAVKVLLVDGAYLRKNDSEVSVATELLEKVLPRSAQWLRNVRSMSRLEVATAQRRPAFVPPEGIWTEYTNPEHAAAHVDFIARRAADFVFDLVLRSASARTGAPPELVAVLEQRGRHPRRPTRARPPGRTTDTR